jgi:membrane fusion protein, heavy metal efflux system
MISEPSFIMRQAKTSAVFSLSLLLSALSLSVLSACTASAPPEAAEEQTPQVDAQGRIQLTEAQTQQLGIQQAPAVQATAVPVTGLPAQVMAAMASSVHVTLPYAGVVTRVLVDEGESVQRGQPMLRVQSRELIAMQSELAKAQAEFGVAAQQAQRDELLANEGLIPTARLQESKARAHVAKAAIQQAQASLVLLRPSGGAAGEFELLAPQAGRVLHRQVAPGQVLEAMAAAFTLAGDDRLDVQFSVPVELASQLQIGQIVMLPKDEKARVAAVGGDADVGGQSIRVRAQLEAGSHLLPGQQFAVALQLPAAAGALSIPVTALLQDGEQHVVFVQDGAAWRRVQVRQLGGDARIAIVQADELKAGMLVAVTGGNVLKTLLAVE